MPDRPRPISKAHQEPDIVKQLIGPDSPFESRMNTLAKMAAKEPGLEEFASIARQWYAAVDPAEPSCGCHAKGSPLELGDEHWADCVHGWSEVHVLRELRALLAKVDPVPIDVQSALDRAASHVDPKSGDSEMLVDPVTGRDLWEGGNQGPPAPRPGGEPSYSFHSRRGRYR